MAATAVCELDPEPNGSTALDGPARPDGFAAVVQAVLSYGASFLRVYHRHEIHSGGELPDRPLLFVANHGFGGIVDLNVLPRSPRSPPSRPTVTPRSFVTSWPGLSRWGE